MRLLAAARHGRWRALSSVPIRGTLYRASVFDKITAAPGSTMPSSSPQAASCPFETSRRFPVPRQDPMHPPREYAAWGAEQRICRITQWNGAPAWFVTRYEDVRALLMDPRLSADAASPSYPAQTAALALVRREYQVFAQMDPPQHTAERKLLQA